MTGPPQVSIVQSIVTYLLGDATSLKAVILRIISILFAIISYFFITYSDDIAAYFKEAPKNQVILELKEQRIQQYPILAEERALIIYNAINPSSVLVLEYKPQFVNEYASSVAHKGDDILMANYGQVAIDKTSIMYKSNIQGEGVLLELKDQSLAKEPQLVVPNHVFQNMKYIYAYPIFDLYNSYSGAILLLWTKKPSDFDDPEFARRLRLIVLPSVRALGRAK